MHSIKFTQAFRLVISVCLRYCFNDFTFSLCILYLLCCCMQMPYFFRYCRYCYCYCQLVDVVLQYMYILVVFFLFCALCANPPHFYASERTNQAQNKITVKRNKTESLLFFCCYHLIFIPGSRKKWGRKRARERDRRARILSKCQRTENLFF